MNRIFYHLQNLFWGVFGLEGFCPGVFVGGVMSGGVCPDTLKFMLTEFINSVFNRPTQSLTWIHKRN